MSSNIVPKIESIDRKVHQNLDKFQYPYLFMVGIVHFLYFIAFLGIVSIDQGYLHGLSIAIQTFVVLFLLYRFHPFGNRYILKPVDKTIIFGSALLLGTNLLTVEFSKWTTFVKPNTKTMSTSWMDSNVPAESALIVPAQ